MTALPEDDLLLPEALFDGDTIRPGMALRITGGVVQAVEPAAGRSGRVLPGLLAPGFVDLQVNGGGGRMVDGRCDVAALRTICAAHRGLGTAGLLPTLITDRPEATAQVIAAGIAAARAGVPGFLGLHLEGPHLDPRRHGAHDPALIRPMTDEDLARLCDAARALPALVVTVAPEAARPDQIARLAGAGAVVSLGHSDCSHEAAQTALAAGARMITHLFNAMSPLGHRAPGLPGAALTSNAALGLIADGVHVHPAVIALVLAARADGVFLVSDAMACAGTDDTGFDLAGRRILRRDGRLTLADGTLAGADLTLARAVQVTVEAGASPARALAMASRLPAALIGAEDRAGRIAPGRAADLVLLRPDLGLRGLCMGGDWLLPPPPPTAG